MENRLPYFYIKENFENTRGIRIYTSDDIPRNIETLNERFYELPGELILEIEKNGYLYISWFDDEYISSYIRKIQGGAASFWYRSVYKKSTADR